MAHRGFRKTGVLGDLRPRGGAGAAQEVQHGALIDLPHPGGGADGRTFCANHELRLLSNQGVPTKVIRVRPEKGKKVYIRWLPGDDNRAQATIRARRA
ncbi:hypothetical protein GCM10027598_57410 [Amycolatopsis oliviviridis]|uniref:Uncharacterized protein n=1 Tax=Amycolatopsis oliviviridis TaxID=1471590 RepID=A0ABQ3LWI7_9PSEU|nr:hypothetical protein GCM10017790_58060 [Amycolatopsis oliviviridis]